MRNSPEIGLNGVGTANKIIQKVENISGSIGYTSLYFANQAHDVMILSIDDQNPHNLSAVKRNAYAYEASNTCLPANLEARLPNRFSPIYRAMK